MEKYIGRPTSLEGRSEVEVNTYDFLDKLGISYETMCHAAAFTMEECQEVDKKVLLVVDNDLLGSEFFGCHPCVNTATLKIRLKDLLEKIVPFTNHEYRIVTLKTE